MHTCLFLHRHIGRGPPWLSVLPSWSTLVHKRRISVDQFDPGPVAIAKVRASRSIVGLADPPRGF
jgi:hypothetical protein